MFQSNDKNPETEFRKSKNVTALEPNHFSKTQITKGPNNKRHGLLMAYAPWCGHCKSKIDDIICLADSMKQENWKMYTLNADKHCDILDIEKYPTFFSVDGKGQTVKLTEVRGVDDAVIKMCQANEDKCIEEVQQPFNSSKCRKR